MSIVRLLVLSLAVTVGLSGTGAEGLSLSEVSVPGLSCVGLDPPADGEIIAPFAPGPGYSGHWGVDFPLAPEGEVRAAAGGRVTFSGRVVKNLVVTIDHGGGLKTSYSYLDRSLVTMGQRVNRGMVIGRATGGSLHDGLHFSVRIDGEYVDPETVLGCQPAGPSAGLRLVPADSPTPSKES